MSTVPDVAQATIYVFGRLERELPPALYYHSPAHTRDDVLPAALRLASLEGVTGDDLLLLATAALYHDVGFIVRYLDHEVASAALAAQSLPAFGYSDDQIQRICDLIMATVVTAEPSDRLQAILKDADLDVLGRDDFWASNLLLLNETRVHVGPVDEVSWYADQARFLDAHVYFTESARALRAAGKRQNLGRLQAQLGLFWEGASE